MLVEEAEAQAVDQGPQVPPRAHGYPQNQQWELVNPNQPLYYSFYHYHTLFSQ